MLVLFHVAHEVGGHSLNSTCNFWLKVIDVVARSQLSYLMSSGTNCYDVDDCM